MMSDDLRPHLPPEALEGVFLLAPGNRDFLTGRSPRLGDSRGHGCLIMFGLVWCLLCSAFVGFLGREWVMMFLLWHDGREVEATVLDLRVRSNSEGTSHSVRYEFRAGPGEGERFEGRRQIGEQTYGALRVGGPVRVRYWAGNPAWSTTETIAWNGWKVLLLMSGFISIFVAVGLLILFGGLRGVLNARRFSREGRIVPGTLLSAEGETDFDGDLWLRITYRILPEGAPPIEGKAGAARNDLKDGELPKPGTPMLALWIAPDKHRVL